MGRPRAIRCSGGGEKSRHAERDNVATSNEGVHAAQTRPGSIKREALMVVTPRTVVRPTRPHASARWHRYRRRLYRQMRTGEKNLDFRRFHGRDVDGRAPKSLNTGSFGGVSGCTSNLFSQSAADDLDGSNPAGSESEPFDCGVQFEPTMC